MDGLVLDAEFNVLAVLDVFDSFIWTERYFGFGDFEVVMPMRIDVLEYMKLNNYIMVNGSDRMMIIETLELTTDFESGDKLKITGRSLESILDRRIIWGNKILSGSFQDAIQTLLTENVINPSQNGRDPIPKFSFLQSEDPYILNLTIDVQFTGDNLYDAILGMCLDKNIGFQVLPTANGGFSFQLYKGLDRSYGQDILPYVIFSSSFENLLSSEYIESERALKTAALVGGDGEGPERIFAEVLGTRTGLHRREIFVETSGVSSKDVDRATYISQLQSAGREELAKTEITTAFSGEVDSTQQQFVYGKDFFIGDIVQIVNHYNMESKTRVSELIRSHNTEGEAVYPTFMAIYNM